MFFPSPTQAPCLPRTLRAIHRGTLRCLRLSSCTLLSTKALGLCPRRNSRKCVFLVKFVKFHMHSYLAYWFWCLASFCFGEKLLCFKVCVWTASASKPFQTFHHSAMYNSVLSRTNSQYTKSTTLKNHKDLGIVTKSQTSAVLSTAALHLYRGTGLRPHLCKRICWRRCSLLSLLGGFDLRIPTWPSRIPS